MNRALGFAAATIAAAVIAPIALADPPQTIPQPLPPTFTLSGLCAFDVRFDVLAQKEVERIFTNGKTLITGRLVLRLTNVSNPANSDVEQVNGPIFGHVGSADVISTGTSIILGFPGLVLTHGPVVVTPTSFTPTSASSVDLCALLTGP